MKEEDLEFYKNIIKNSRYEITSDNIDDYLDFCLNEVGKNILYCYKPCLSSEYVITELFKRVLIKRCNQLHPHRNHKRKCFHIEYNNTVFKRFKLSLLNNYR